MEHEADKIFRASCLSGPIARSFASRMARVNRSSCNARIRAASHGLCCAGDREERASQR
jgi:hypothetical protein